MSYGGARTAHIHFAINQNGQRVLTTQMYVKDNPTNEQDFIIIAFEIFLIENAHRLFQITVGIFRF